METKELTPEEYKARYGVALDKKIAPLVKDLNKLGYTTIASCEGGIKHDSPFPWIRFPKRSINTIRTFIKEYNKENPKERWRFKNMGMGATENTTGKGFHALYYYQLEPVGKKDAEKSLERLKEYAKAKAEKKYRKKVYA